MADQFAHYRAWRDGHDTSAYPVKDGYIICGFFCAPDLQPVAIWQDAQGYIMQVGAKQTRDIRRIERTTADLLRAKNGGRPVTKAEFVAVTHGEEWPHIRHVLPPEIGNAPIPDTPETLADAIFEVKRSLDKILAKGPLANEEDARDVAVLKDSAYKLEAQADAIRIREKRPHDDAAKAVQALWKPVVDQAAAQKARAAKAGTDYLLGVRAEQRRREAEEAAHRLAAQSDDSGLDAAGADPGAGQEAPAQAGAGAADAKVSVGGLTLTERKVCVVTDFKLAATHLINLDPCPEDIRVAVAKTVRALHKAGISVPGTELQTVHGAI